MEINGFTDTIAWYDANASDYASKTDHFVRTEIIGQFLTLLPSTSAKVLDAGCGVGKTTRTLAEKGLDLIGVDISEGLLKEAKKRAPSLTFIKGDMRSLGFPDNKFDGIFAQASLVHLESLDDVSKTLMEFNRVLTTQGVLFFSVKAKRGEDETEIVTDKLSNHPRFFRYYTQDQLTSLLTKHHFEVVNIKQENETIQDPNGRPEVDWIFVFAKKLK